VCVSAFRAADPTPLKDYYAFAEAAARSFNASGNVGWGGVVSGRKHSERAEKPPAGSAPLETNQRKTWRLRDGR
jgi:hypothetical protein